MPRQLRLELAGGFYHVMARGDRLEAIFLDAGDREDWLEGLGHVCQRLGWRVHAWVLLDNHYHFLLETPEPNLVRGMRELQQGYTQRFNRRHRLSGHLFGGRYKAVVVDGQAPEHPSERRRRAQARTIDLSDYFLMVADYIHLNPVRARLVKVDQGKGILAYAWSSLRWEYAQRPARRHPWMELGRVLAGCDLADTAVGRRKLVGRLEGLAREEGAAQARLAVPEGQSLQATLRRGWYFGRQEFGEKTLKKVKAAGRILLRRPDEHYEGAKIQRQHGEMEAERLVRAGFRLLRVDPKNVTRGDQSLVVLAQLLRERTGVSHAWLAERLGLRNAANLSQRLARLKREAKTNAAIRRLQTQLRQSSCFPS